MTIVGWIGSVILGAIALLPWYWLVRAKWEDWREHRWVL
jgi:hypothetical protein